MRDAGPDRYSIAIILVLGLVFVLLVWLVPEFVQGPLSTDPTLRASDVASLNGLRTAVAAVLVGLGALGTFYVNSRSQKTADATLRLATRGQLTERYAKCIEQLGSRNQEIVLGGIYGLEQFARESNQPADQGVVAEILSSFIRRRADANQYSEDEEVPPASPEVQAALTVLGRLPYIPDILRADLREIVLVGAELHNADLRGASLEKSHFGTCKLNGADLRRSSFELSTFYFSLLSEAKISDEECPADFSGAEFSHADLSEATVTHAKLHGARFDGAILSGADFTNTELTGSSFVGATVYAHGQHDPTQIVHGSSSSLKRQLGPAIFAGADLRETQGLPWSVLRHSVSSDSTRLDEETSSARQATIYARKAQKPTERRLDR